MKYVFALLMSSNTKLYISSPSVHTGNMKRCPCFIFKMFLHLTSVEDRWLGECHHLSCFSLFVDSCTCYWYRNLHLDLGTCSIEFSWCSSWFLSWCGRREHSLQSWNSTSSPTLLTTPEFLPFPGGWWKHGANVLYSLCLPKLSSLYGWH